MLSLDDAEDRQATRVFGLSTHQLRHRHGLLSGRPGLPAFAQQEPPAGERGKQAGFQCGWRSDFEQRKRLTCRLDCRPWIVRLPAVAPEPFKEARSLSADSAIQGGQNMLSSAFWMARPARRLRRLLQQRRTSLRKPQGL